MLLICIHIIINRVTQYISKGDTDPPKRSSHSLGSCIKKSSGRRPLLPNPFQTRIPTHRSEAFTPLGVALKTIVIVMKGIIVIGIVMKGVIVIVILIVMKGVMVIVILMEIFIVMVIATIISTFTIKITVIQVVMIVMC
jgi:hypothetical protein